MALRWAIRAKSSSECEHDGDVGGNIEVGDLPRQHLLKTIRRGITIIMIVLS